MVDENVTWLQGNKNILSKLINSSCFHDLWSIISRNIKRLKQHSHILNQHACEGVLPPKHKQIKNICIKRSPFYILERNMKILRGKWVHPWGWCISQVFGTIWSVGNHSIGKLLFTTANACSTPHVQSRSFFNPNIYVKWILPGLYPCVIECYRCNFMFIDFF